MLHSYNSYLLLLESKRRDQLKKKYIDNFGMSHSVFDKLYSKNAEWLMKIYSKTPQEKQNEIELQTSYSFDDLLLKYANMFDNNKENLSVKQIGKIKDVDQMKEILDEIREVEMYDKGQRDDDLWVLENNYEWFIFKAYTYEYSELANNKKRSSNWCTTYDEGYFNSYLGPKGGLIYICNKLDETQDWALECSTDSMKAWNHKDNDEYNSYDLEKLIEKIWDKDEYPYKILKSKLKELEEDLPEIDWNKARENARDEIMNWQFSKYNNLKSYSSYVWYHVDDDRFLDDMKDGEYERYIYDWKYEGDLLEKLKTIMYDYFSNDGWNREKVREQITQYFIEQMKEHNESSIEDMEPNEAEEYLEENGYDTKNPDYQDFDQFLDDNCNDSDAKELIEQFGFEEDLIEILVNDYMDNFSDAKDYVSNVYGDPYGSEAIGYVEGYIKWSDLADAIVEDMDEEELRNYM